MPVDPEFKNRALTETATAIADLERETAAFLKAYKEGELVDAFNVLGHVGKACAYLRRNMKVLIMLNALEKPEQAQLLLMHYIQKSEMPAPEAVMDKASGVLQMAALKHLREIFGEEAVDDDDKDSGGPAQ